ncbi:elongation factor Ts [Candidatus Uhrbacteria bacterium RIFOXYB12_FULL_58_10]|uniref:Elongation factor Ts n=1 Tax=Candidatus Uhrbacteria bacterium RIFOXYB2_FULL_57_15 TaxID=1802422 RepID=A0A1F7WA06_9BACT|nr:MAG: elongation factor Ts [Candidatus Uhrbacteria bacterium RIFOXYB12_FULL_58_10]OGL98914.1 MAG: elongation factor Ts [Candidatus Uhrbacteria bacterium RIFOXYB2_FULL_57_15]OGM00072.1 MAG: elongation factor Ts [Candidatus Uhrbacteria bacterium RIFOXYC12_FULL_57_11]
MMIDAKLVAQLREMTGAGMMDAKKSLEGTNGDLTAAAEALRAKGLAKAASKSDRATKEGRVFSYIHSNGKLGAMVEVLCETDFVARNEAFTELCHDLAMHISAADPLYVKREDVPAEVVAKEREIYAAEMAEQAKPAEIVEKIVEGKLNKYFSDVCLLEQPFIKDEDTTVDEFVKAKIATIGENIQVSRFSRFQIG